MEIKKFLTTVYKIERARLKTAKSLQGGSLNKFSEDDRKCLAATWMSS